MEGSEFKASVLECMIKNLKKGFGGDYGVKNIYFCFIDYAKAFHCVDHNQLWKILKEFTTPPDLPLEKSVCRSGSNS